MEKFDQNPWDVRSESPEIDPLYRGSIKTHRGFIEEDRGKNRALS